MKAIFQISHNDKDLFIFLFVFHHIMYKEHKN